MLCDLLCTVGPTITTGPRNETVVDPNPAYFNCTAEGVPRPDISWIVMQNGMMLEISSNLADFNVTILEAGDRQATSILRVNSARPALAAIYTCLASNVVRNTTESASLLVHSKFTVLK